MLRSRIGLAFPASLGLALLFALTAGLARADGRTVSFDTTIGPPPATSSFDIGFVKNDIAKYVLADRTNNAVDLFAAAAPAFSGYIGQGGFVGNHPACAVPHACSGPNGDLIDSSNNVWAADGPASDCSTATCACFAGETTSMVKEYTLATGTASARLACLDTGGKFRADEMAFDPRDNLLLVANDADGFLSLIKTTTASIADQFFYADNDVGKPASAGGLSTAGNGIEQPVYDPQQGFFYQAIPQGNSVGRIDIFNPKSGKLVFLRSLDVANCNGGPTGLAIDASTDLLGACANGAALINANNGKSSIIGSAATTGGADEVWFDPGSDAWYLSTPGQLGVVSAGSGHTVNDATHAGCCGHSVAAYSAGPSKSLIFDPNSAGTGVSVFQSVP
jgi:hypothetical protein